MNRIVGGTTVAIAWLVATGAFAQNQALVERGMKIYAEQKCSVCHAIAGKGNAKGSLDDVGSRLKPDEIRAWLVNPAEMTKKTKAERQGRVRPHHRLPKEDIDAMVAYMVSLKNK